MMWELYPSLFATDPVLHPVAHEGESSLRCRGPMPCQSGLVCRQGESGNLRSRNTRALRVVSSSYVKVDIRGVRSC